MLPSGTGGLTAGFVYPKARRIRRHKPVIAALAVTGATGGVGRMTAALIESDLPGLLLSSTRGRASLSKANGANHWRHAK